MVRGFDSRALWVLMAMLAVAAIVSGCGSSDRPGETKLALLLPTEPVVRYLGQPGFGEKVSELCARCRVLYGNARGSVGRQSAQAERALAEGADALVVDPVDPGAASRIVREARSADVPVIAYVHPILSPKADYYVGVNGEGLGKLQAEVLLTELEKEGRPRGPIVIVATGTGGPQNVNARTTLLSGGARIAREYEIDESASAAEAFSLARRDMSSAIDALGHNGFAAVFTLDDETAAGTIAAMKAEGIDPRDKATTGAGASLSAVKRVLVGEQYLSAYEANWQVRSAAARVAVRLGKGNAIPASWVTEKLAGSAGEVPATLLEPTTVSAENLMSTVIPYGFIKPKQLCVGRYARYCAEAPRPIH